MFRNSWLALPMVLAAFAAGPVLAASAQSGPFGSPARCSQIGPNGELPTCTQDASGKWTVSYPDSSPGSGSGVTIPGLIVLGLLVSGGLLFWRISMARRMATEAGIDPGRATAMTVLTHDGLDATYLAASLHQNGAAEPAPATPTRNAADRLRELDNLRNDGLVTPAEYDARRQAIVDSV